MEDLHDLYRGRGKTLLKLTKTIRHSNDPVPFEWWVYSPLLKPKLIRGSETAKVDCPERVGPVVASSFDSMTGINGLPKEILHEIVSYLSPHISELLMSSLVCRGLSEVANAALYRDIDLSIVDLSIDERWDEQAGAKTRRRQLRLLRSISEYIYSSQMVYHY